MYVAYFHRHVNTQKWRNALARMVLTYACIYSLPCCHFLVYSFVFLCLSFFPTVPSGSLAFVLLFICLVLSWCLSVTQFLPIHFWTMLLKGALVSSCCFQCCHLQLYCYWMLLERFGNKCYIELNYYAHLLRRYFFYSLIRRISRNAIKN